MDVGIGPEVLLCAESGRGKLFPSGDKINPQEWFIRGSADGVSRRLPGDRIESAAHRRPNSMD
jgi:hypothetical protein